MEPWNADMYNITKDWLSFIQVRNRRPTYVTYRSAIHLFLENLPLNISPDKVTPQHILRFLTAVTQTHKVSSANHYLKIVKLFYHWADDFYSGKVPNPTKPVTPLREPPPSRRILSQAEYQAILDATQGEARKALQFLANTGLRRNEFRFLTWSDFNGDFVHIIGGKGGKSRCVPLNHICKEVLDEPRVGDAPCFVRKYRPYKSLYTLCTQIARRANIKYFSPHAFRHFFATRLVTKGVPLKIISEILGHSSVETTERLYVHIQTTDLRVTDCLSE